VPDPSAPTGPRTALARIAGAALIVTGISILPGPIGPQPAAAASGKITICHRTHSTTNPYRRITVSQNAVTNSRHGGHSVPNGSANPAVYDSTYSYAPNNKVWGDIIPGSTSGGSAYNGSNGIALNWTTAGIAAFSNFCAPLSARAFYDVELAAGVAPADIVADLNDQAANEDAALLASLGGAFTLANVGSWDSAVAVTTGDPSATAPTSATLTGTITVGAISTAVGFDWGTSPTLATYSTVSAGPNVSSTTATVSAIVTGLTPEGTYYYRLTGTTNAGTDAEGVLYGAIRSFATPLTATTTTTTTTTTVPSSTTSTTAPSTTTTTSPTAPSSTTTTIPSTTTTSPTAPSSTTTTIPSTTTTSPTAPSSTTTTVPSTTTTTAPPKVGGAALRGMVWFDRNGDGRRDEGEWPLPGVEVTLRSAPGEAVGSPRPAVAASLKSVSMKTVALRAASTQPATTTRTARTDAAGNYTFDGLSAGDYIVSARADLPGFDRTSDSDGGLDWLVTATVPNGVTAVVDFAGLGRGTIVADVFERSSRRPLADAAVTCRWAGYDDILGNEDDVDLPARTDSDGSVELRGVAYGTYRCWAVDADGREAAPIDVMVRSADITQAVLPVSRDLPVGFLPVTGSNAPRLVLVALLLTAGGATLLAASGRRRRGPAPRRGSPRPDGPNAR
jgi:hypothetical protein